MIFGIVEGQSLRISTEKIVSDSFNYLTAKFFFSEDWAGTVKWAHFVQGDNQYDIMLDADDEIKQDKHLTLQEGCWTVYLHGSRMDGDEVTERITTEQRGIKVLESGVVDGEPIPLPPSAAEQILAYAMEAREKIANLQADAETLEPGAEATAEYDYESDTMTFGIPRGEKGETGEQGPQGKPFTLEDFEQTETYQAIIANEEARETAEDERELAEESRETAEQNRVNAEAERVSAEAERVSAEAERVDDESSRVSAESSRVSAESARVSAESARVTAEAGRVAAEESRVTAESERAAAEEERATEFAGFESQIASKADKTELADTDRNLKYLYELTRGQSWDLERGTNPAYQQIVPSGAHKADVLMFGGKTIVDEGRLLSAKVEEAESKDASNNIIGTIAVPAAVKALPGYGWSAGDAYNYIDLEKRQFHKRVEAVDLGSLNWTLESAVGRDNTFYSNIPARKSGVNCGGICDKYSWQNSGWVVDKTINYYPYHGAQNVFIKDSSYTDATEFKAAINGVMLYYELAEEIVTDISDLWTDPTYLDAEAGGTLTFKQSDDTQLEIPNNTEYYINLSEVTPNA